jgi:hypothetical protein
MVMRSRRMLPVVVVALVLVATAQLAVTRPARASARSRSASSTWVPGDPLSCSSWRYGAADEPASLPSEFDRNNYKRTSLRDPNPALSGSLQNLCGQKGSAVDLAWGLTEGSPAVSIAVLDSGIRWRDHGSMVELATKAHINLGEAQPSCYPVVADGDCNHDGVFNITDFGAIPDLNGNGIADPEDLILSPTYNNHVDDDHNGYVDDISGWDFLYGDNDPLDTVDYGHGTGEAKDSTAAANGTGDVGVCAECQFLPVRVGDSFIADGGRFAAGVLFALDSGAGVIQEALGALNNPRQAQEAIDAAYRRNVVVVASMADEASKHPNLPASLEHTLAVNSVTEKTSNPLGGGSVQGYLALNGCTNFGGHTFVSVPSDSCSSEATGIASGMVGLVESYARHLHVTLTANEVMQIVRSTADDVDFSTPNAVDPANNFGTPTGNPLIDTVRYPSTKGWDATFGYGRVNAYEMVKAVRDGRIPPEAMIDSPSWFDVLPATGTVPVTGRVAAPRATSYDYRVEWAPGLQPPLYPATDHWTSIGGGSGLTAPRSGTLATLDLASVAAALPANATGTPIDASNHDRPDEERFSVRVRVVVTAHGGDGDGLTGEMQKQVFVHDDPDLASGFPLKIPGVSVSSPRFVDLLRDGRTEMLVATADGEIHAYLPNMSELPGFPLMADVSSWWPGASPTAAADGIPVHRGAFMVGAPAVGDLNRDGHLEVVDTDLDGHVYVWSAIGTRLATMSVDPAYSRDRTDSQDQYNRTLPGFASSPSLGDLDGDGKLEIVAGALDRHLYAWHADGTPVAGFPVLLVDPAKVQAVDPTSHKVTFTPGSGVREGGEIVATPTVVDVNGDGKPEIVVGAQEEYVETPNVGDGAGVLALLNASGQPGNTRLYVVAHDGTDAHNPDTSAAHPDEQAYLPGWPAKLSMLSTGLLPTIGNGVAMQAAVGDVDAAHPGPEIVAVSAAGTVYVLDAAGHSVYGSTATGDLPVLWAGGLALENAGLFGANRNSNDLVASVVGFAGPSIGELSGGGAKELAAPTLGITRLIDLLAPDLQLPNDDQVSAWDGATGRPLPGFPQATADLSFFVAPAIADLDGDGHNEVISGNSLYTLTAFDANGDAPPGWPKLTGGWSIGTPGVGDWNGDGTLEVAQQTRQGTLFVWGTGGTATPAWGSYGCDSYNSGACVDTAAASLPTTTTTTSVPPTTTAPSSTAPPTTTGSGSSTTAAPAAAAAADTGSGGSTDSGLLPFTGATLGGVIVAALVLLGAGWLLLAARRRRTTST